MAFREFFGCRDRLVPTFFRNVKAQGRKDCVGFVWPAGKTLSGSRDPVKCLLRFVSLAQGINDVQMSGVNALTVWEAIAVLGVPCRRFGKPAHAKKGSGAVVQAFTAFFGRRIFLSKTIEDWITIF